MKKDIHPTYYPEGKIECACGNIITVGTTKESIQVETCSACHPFFTGREKSLETVGRVQKFKERMAKTEKTKTPSASKSKKKST